MPHRLLAFSLIVVACASDPPAPSTADAAAMDAAEAAPCGGACGPGTVCESGRCVAVAPADAGLDTVSDAAAPDVAAEPSSDALADTTIVVDAADASAPACGLGLTRCGDGCADTTRDPDNCGACGARCGRDPTRHIVPVCVMGACAPATCEQHWGDCNNNLSTDGCESDLRRVTSCGACGTSCARGVGCVPRGDAGAYACASSM